ncbi:MAG: rRNA pseudouridine synthase [Pyrinomonadaceae bacterium]|nr:rRNA pseudouridine synthase [Pyrinomonadaceae bacterium]MCX7639349.1 rRNA pseudouridine synthase [Pyrinomonadaceae bacterium]MDW8305235.1 pseudouridine synthase [Acidobacteriota bacterium]
MALERLQKLIAQAGVASRRKAEELIRSGAVTVNGKTVTQLGTKADPEIDHIKVNGKLINPKLKKRKNVYLLLNKPKGVLSSTADPQGRRLVVDFVPLKYGKVFPVGRLDYNTEGLIILTNDGELANLIASSRVIPKTYRVKVKGIPPEKAIESLRRGIRLEDGYKTAPAEINLIKTTEKNAWYEVILYEGHNHQIRKMFDAIGHSVVKLRRTRIGHLTDKGLSVGKVRELSPEEVQRFFAFSAEKSKKMKY